MFVTSRHILTFIPSMKQYKKINDLVGWFVFLFAAFVYCSTIEPTASFWDCPEFITTAYKFEVGHPPGAPFFMLFGNLFTQFVSDPSQVAKMINIMSALLSAACILFLFWTITHLVRRLICHKGIVETTAQTITIIGSGVVGALAYTFSDTFWFSAVEGEVYAFSSMFTALVFWLILKWEDNADKPHSDRFLILIAYLMGLSIGVHLLNLLCIPAMVLVYYYHKSGSKSNLKGSLLVLLLSFALVGIILWGVVPGMVKVAGVFELLFVNTFGLKFNTGVIVYLLLLIATVLWGIYESYSGRSAKKMNISFLISIGLLGIPFFGTGLSCVVAGIIILSVIGLLLFKHRKIRKSTMLPRVLNTTLLCCLMLMIGYSSYAVIVIRSTANPPMDQNSPEDVFTLAEYLNRDQYGSTPLLYGPAYTSQIKTVREGDYLVPVRKKGAPIYQRKEKKSADEKDSYEKIGYKEDYVYAQNLIFPRVWNEGYAGQYESWVGGIKGHLVDYDRGDGRVIQVKVPTQFENLKFFFRYQLNFMYWRYFMWNFAGRQNDIQGYGEAEHGNWISGIPFIDNLRLGNQNYLPDELKNNKGNNKFYMLPLLLGLIGIFWQAYRGKKGIRQFWVVFFLFFMTGIAIVLYLNQTPQQPRERDYAYAGSFYAFAIWIGLGVAAITEWLHRMKLNENVKAAIVAAACVLIPLQMGSQTWDDHDRSNRYTCRDFGQNYLYSITEKNHPIIFTNGDNDTYPLWYNQETEGVRTDARVCNMSYLQTPWYIEQLRRPAYDSPAVPINWNRYEYVTGQNEAVQVRTELKEQLKQLYRKNPEEARKAFGDDPFELQNIMKYWVRSADPNMHFIPTDSIKLKIDKEAVRRSDMLMISDSIPDYIYINVGKRNALYKNSLMQLEMLANCNWERPLYFAVTVGPDNFLELRDYFIQEGLAYRITPFNTQQLANASGLRFAMNVDVDKMYDNLMNKFKFGGISNPKVYLDETVYRMCITHRRMFAILAQALVEKGDLERAKKVLEKAEKEIPDNVSYGENLGGTQILANCWAACGEKQRAERLLKIMAKSATQYLNWYIYHSPDDVTYNSFYCNTHFEDLLEVARIMQDIESPEAEALLQQTADIYGQLQARGIKINL